MIISSARQLDANDIADFAWSRLGKYQNIESTANLISSLHRLDSKHATHARAQAEQIRYCLAQAKEYWTAANAVSLVTRPVLLYYCTMSLALAEILLKQTGESRLAKLREQHNCHGLQLTVHSAPKPDDAFRTIASVLVAKPQLGSLSSPRGTFEIWRRSAREHPICGLVTTTFPDRGTETGFEVILWPFDTPTPDLPLSGISLHSCVTHLPYMGDVLGHVGARLEMVRATVAKSRFTATGTPTLSITIQPAPSDLIDQFGTLVKAEAAVVNYVDIREFTSGYSVNYPLDPNLPRFHSYPEAIMLNTEDTYFSCSDHKLGEFGYIYAALHICGNFARYYPDLWVKHVERSSALSIVVDELCTNAFKRLPLLSLSEFTRAYHVVRK